MITLLFLAVAGVSIQDPAPQIPIRQGLVIVQAVAGDVEKGDYEATIEVASVSADAITLQGAAFVKDDAGVRRWLRVTRRQLPPDLREARTQILGFHTDDPVTLPETTALGPSVLVLDELRDAGRSDVVVRNYASRRDNAGTLTRRTHDRVPFPVLLNGRRVTLPAIHTRGQLGVPGSMRPWELYILDHPTLPLTLKVSYGPEGAAEDGSMEWSRQIVRIDFPEDSAIEKELAEDCRVRVPGIYFEFDSDVLNPASEPRVRWIADLLRRRPDWTVTIEGHTDSVGTARYNLDLSGRRAAALKHALVQRHGIDGPRLKTEGFGFSRPLEPNSTFEGRARNRRVELVRPCGGRDG
jgi:outer membrane protein OmpA-like peptidoglycan-associated protein